MTRGTVAQQAPPCMRFPRREYWSGLPFPPPGDLPDSGIDPSSPVPPALAGGFFITEPPWEAPILHLILAKRPKSKAACRQWTSKMNASPAERGGNDSSPWGCTHWQHPPLGAHDTKETPVLTVPRRRTPSGPPVPRPRCRQAPGLANGWAGTQSLPPAGRVAKTRPSPARPRQLPIGPAPLCLLNDVFASTQLRW